MRIRKKTKGGKKGFTLVELLVVIGIISVLISILLPAVSSARSYGHRIACASNLRQVYLFLRMYGNDNRDWVFPDHWGFTPTVPPEKRWPAYVFNAWDPDDHDHSNSRIKVMTCPSDGQDAPDRVTDHSFIINDYLGQPNPPVKDHDAGRADKYYSVRYSSKGNIKIPFEDVILMGEKKSTLNDFYMEVSTAGNDYLNLVEEYRHGPRHGSNYLFLGGNVINRYPKATDAQENPWDPPSN